MATKEQKQAYTALRVLTGFDFFGHGFARIALGSHLAGFAQGMVKNMAGTPLPPGLVLAMGYVIPVVELGVGILLLLGVATRYALWAALLLMCVLMFGITLKQDWAIASQQLLYGFVLAALLFGRERFDLSWPAVFQRS
ncbi:MAG TPA: MauE/DoxX family redox-associated membrane protein [Acidobacteriaceae bacterium]